MTTIISIYGHVVIGNLQHQFPKLTCSDSVCHESCLGHDVPSLLARNAGSVLQCCDSCYNCQASWRLIRAHQSSPARRPPSARISPALVSVTGTQRLDPGLGRKFYKIVSFVVSVAGSALPSCVFQSILWCYKLPQYICSPRVHCLLFMFKTLWLKRGFKSAALASLFPSVSSMIRNASHSLLDLVVCSTFLVTIP